MHLIRAVIILSFFVPLSILGQIDSYKRLLDSAIKSKEQLFVNVKPITKTNLNCNEISKYSSSYEFFSRGKTLDTVMFLQIIQNIKELDTSLWTNEELENSILITRPDEFINPKEVIKKFNPATRKEKRHYKKLIAIFNNTSSFNKEIYSYSRPIFNNSKKYAIIIWDNQHSGLCCGGGIELFQFVSGTWNKLGSVIEWKY